MRMNNRKAALLFAGAAVLLAVPARAQPAGTGTTTGGTPTTMPGTPPSTTTPNPTQMQSGGSITPSAPANGNSTTNTTGQMNSTGTTSGDSSLYPACDRTQMHSGTSTTDTTGMNPNCPGRNAMPVGPNSSTGGGTSQ